MRSRPCHPVAAVSCCRPTSPTPRSRSPASASWSTRAWRANRGSTPHRSDPTHDGDDEPRPRPSNGPAGRGASSRVWCAGCGARSNTAPRLVTASPEIAEADLAGLALELAAGERRTAETTGRLSSSIRRRQSARAGPRVARRTPVRGVDPLDAAGSPNSAGRCWGFRSIRAWPGWSPSSAMLACVDRLHRRRTRHPARPARRPPGRPRRCASASSPGRRPRRRRSGRGQRLRDRARDLARRAGIDSTLGSIDVDASGARCSCLPRTGRRPAPRRPVPAPVRWRGLAPGRRLRWPTEPFVVAADLDGRGDRSTDPARRRARRRPTSSRRSAPTRRTAEFDVGHGRDDLVDVVDPRLGAMRLGRSLRPAGAGDERSRRCFFASASRLAILLWTRRRGRSASGSGSSTAPAGDPWPDWSSRDADSTLDEWLAPVPRLAASRATWSGSTSSRCCGHSSPGRSVPTSTSSLRPAGTAHRPHRGDRLFRR